MAAGRPCETCGSPLDGDQRYCLTCGARAGERSAQLGELLRRVAARALSGAAEAAAAQPQRADAAGRAANGSDPLHLPGPRVSALLIAVFVGFGALIGNAAAGGGGALPARAVRLVTPPSSQSAGTSGSGEAAGGSGGAHAGSQAPESEPEATPAPAAEKGAGGSGASSEAGTEGNGSSKTGGSGEGTPSAGSHKHAAAPRKLTSVNHVFVLVLSDQPYAALFGPESNGRYLAGTLERKGELLVSYDAIAHEQLPNGIALISGQGPTAQTAANCPSYTPLLPGTPAPDGQVLGDGCIYPASVETLPGQLSTKHLRWRGYVQGIGEGAGQPAACAHPAPGAADPTVAAGAYATYRNPFVYFDSIAQSPACQTNDVGLSQLKTDLASAAQTPNLAYIVPDRCHDASPNPCSPGAATGPAAAGVQLEQIVSQIRDSPAYKQDGLLVITADEAPSTGELADSSSCCGQPKYPNYTSSLLGQGGGQVGALLLSPFIKGGTTSQEQYDHFSLLRTIEDIFGVRHLGYAALPGVKSFSASLLNG